MALFGELAWTAPLRLEAQQVSQCQPADRQRSDLEKTAARHAVAKRSCAASPDSEHGPSPKSSRQIVMISVSLFRHSRGDGKCPFDSCDIPLPILDGDRQFATAASP